MELDTDKIDDAVLALLLLGRHDGDRAWKGFDWGAMDRLYEAGYITEPKGKAKSIVFTDEGLERASRLLKKLFGKQAESGTAEAHDDCNDLPKRKVTTVAAPAELGRSSIPKAAETNEECVMAGGISLTELVQEMEILGEGMQAFVNRRTGEIYSATDDFLSRVEDEDSAEVDWEIEIIDKLREILGSPDWITVPNRPTYEDYRIMERFCYERCENDLQNELLSAIVGRRRFSRFKDTLHSNGVQDEWYEFRRKVLTEDAKAWLTVNEIPFVS